MSLMKKRKEQIPGGKYGSGNEFKEPGVGWGLLSSIVTITEAIWWAGPKLEQDQHKRLGMEQILVYEDPKDTQITNEELRG